MKRPAKFFSIHGSGENFRLKNCSVLLSGLIKSLLLSFRIKNIKLRVPYKILSLENHKELNLANLDWPKNENELILQFLFL